MAVKEAAEDTVTQQRRNFETWVRRRGLKRSGTRGAVIDIFLRSTKHMSCNDVYEIVRRRNLKIGFSTVYRTLKLLAAANLAKEVNFGDGVTRYDHNYHFNFRNHYHLICTGCGQAVEFTSKSVEKSQKSAAAKHDFATHHHKLEVYGLCRTCRAVT